MPQPARAFHIEHLFEHPHHVDTIARWIHDEWWTRKPGHSPQRMAARLGEAADAAAIPLSLVALIDDEPVGTVNLVENDDETRRHLRPWLAALLVAPAHRSCGIGSALVLRVRQEARRLGHEAVYLGADIPTFYERLGAVRHEQVSPTMWIMRLATCDHDQAVAC